MMSAARTAQLVCLSLCWLAGCASRATPASSRSLPPSAAPEAGIHAALAAQLGRIQGELERVGLKPATHAFLGFLPTGRHATHALHIQAGECLTLVALATRGARDVDAALYTPEGDALAIDSEPDPHPTIQVCAQVTQDLYYVLQLVDGDGSYVMQPFRGQRSTLAAAARVLGGRPVYAEAVPSRLLQEDSIAALTEGMRKRGFLPARPPDTFKLAAGEQLRTALPVRAGDCYTIAAFGQQPLRDLAARVVDPRDHELVHSEQAATGHAALQLCAHETADYVLEIAARAGSGNVVLLTFRADVATTGGDDGLWLGGREPKRPLSAP